MTQSTKAQRQRLWASCLARGMDQEDIRALISEATHGRTDSSREMKAFEISLLIHDINQKGDTKDNKMRKKIIAMARKLGWQVRDGNKVKPDMLRIDNWCIHYGKYGKRLQEHSYKELCELVTQFEKVYASYL